MFEGGRLIRGTALELTLHVELTQQSKEAVFPTKRNINTGQKCENYQRKEDEAQTLCMKLCSMLDDKQDWWIISVR